MFTAAAEDRCQVATAAPRLETAVAARETNELFRVDVRSHYLETHFAGADTS